MSRASDEAPPELREQTDELCDGHVQARGEHCKKFETIRARLALRGFELRRQGDGTLLVVRWNLARVLPDLSAAEQFAAPAGCGA